MKDYKYYIIEPKSNSTRNRRKEDVKADIAMLVTIAAGAVLIALTAFAAGYYSAAAKAAAIITGGN